MSINFRSTGVLFSYRGRSVSLDVRNISKNISFYQKYFFLSAVFLLGVGAKENLPTNISDAKSNCPRAIPGGEPGDSQLTSPDVYSFSPAALGAAKAFLVVLCDPEEDLVNSFCAKSASECDLIPADSFASSYQSISGKVAKGFGKSCILPIVFQAMNLSGYALETVSNASSCFIEKMNEKQGEKSAELLLGLKIFGIVTACALVLCAVAAAIRHFQQGNNPLAFVPLGNVVGGPPAPANNRCVIS